MGQLESSYSKLGAGCAKNIQKEEVDGGVKTGTKSERKSKGKKESLFRSISWKGRRSTRTSMSDWPAWYHGWCRRTEVEKKLKDGPQGLFIVKNSTEFPGDLTLCVACDREVLYFRVRREGASYTIDNKESFKDVSN